MPLHMSPDAAAHYYRAVRGMTAEQKLASAEALWYAAWSSKLQVFGCNTQSGQTVNSPIESVSSFFVLPPSLFALFVAPLNELGVDYMISGGVAAILYGEPRLTTDVDLILVLPEHTVPKLHAVFDLEEFYVPPIEVMHVEARRRAYGHFNIIHTASAFRADIYIAGTD